MSDAAPASISAAAAANVGKPAALARIVGARMGHGPTDIAEEAIRDLADEEIGREDHGERAVAAVATPTFYG